MSSVIYEGKKVNNSIHDLKSLSSRFPSIASRVQSLTGAMISCKGFEHIGSGVSSTSFSDEVNNGGVELDNFVSTVRNMQVTILSYSNEDKDIQEFLDDLDKNEYNNLDLSGIESHIGVGRKISNGFKSLAASLFTAGAGVIEGVCDFVETGADLLVLGKSAVGSIFTGTYDLLTGSDITKKMWEETKAEVSEKKVENAFNNFYNNTEFGQSIKNNAYFFDAVRGISSGIGYTTAMIGANIVTAGLASGTQIGAAGSVSALRLATTAGVMGFSSGTEDAWADGASIGKGLLYGAATGAWEGTQWAIGAKINQYGGIGDRIASGIFKGAKAGAATRVVLDAVDSGVEGFVQPGLKMIYKDYAGDTFAEKYHNAFEEAGGWSNVRNQAIMGGIMSAGSELMDARKILKSASDGNAQGDTTPKAAGGDGSTDYRTELASEDILERELMEDRMAAAGDYSRHTRSTIDGGYIKTADTEFNTVTALSKKAPDGSIKFMDGAYVPAGQGAGSFLGSEVYYDGASFKALLEQRKDTMSGYDYTRYKEAAEIFASHGKKFNMTELKLILNHSEGNVNRIKSAITMSDSTLMPQNLDDISKELASKLFKSSKNMGYNIERGITGIFIDGMQNKGTDNWKSGDILFSDYYTYEAAMKNLQNSTPETRLSKLNSVFGKGMISDELAREIVNSDGYPETIMRILSTDSNIPKYQLQTLSEVVSTKVFTSHNAARIKAQYEILKGNYDLAGNLMNKGEFGTVFDTTASLFRSSETFSQKAKRFVYYNSIEEAINSGLSKEAALTQARLMYSYAMDQVGTDSAKLSASKLFKSNSNFFGVTTEALEHFDPAKLQRSDLSAYMTQYYNPETRKFSRTQLSGDFESLMGGKDVVLSRPDYIKSSDVDVFKSLEARNVFMEAYLDAANGDTPLESLRVMAKLLELDENNTSLYVYNNGGQGCSHKYKGTINLANQTIDAKNVGTVFHETGHYLFDKVLGEKIPTGFASVRSNAVDNLYSGSNKYLLEALKSDITEVRYFSEYKATSAFKSSLAEKGFSSIDAYKKHLTSVYRGDTIAQRTDRLKTSVVTNGSTYSKTFDRTVAPMFDFSDAQNCATYEINSMKRKTVDAVSRSMGTYSDISGMIDSLTMGKESIWYGHGREYFEGAINPQRNVYHELIADYTSLRVRGETRTIGLLRQLFGTEVMDMLENTYQSMLK